MTRFILLSLLALALLAAAWVVARAALGLLRAAAELGGAAARGTGRVVERVGLAVAWGAGGAAAGYAGASFDPGLDAAATGQLAGAGAFLAALALLGRRGRTVPVARSHPGPSPVGPSTPPIVPDRDPELARAWAAVAAVATGSPDRVEGARLRCGRLLAAADADPLDLELGEWAVFIRRRVPELVDATLAQARAAEGAPARARLVAGLLDDLGRIGAEAERRSRRALGRVADELGTLRRHVADRTRGDAP